MKNNDDRIPSYWPFLAVFIGLSVVLLLELLSHLFTM
jgi:hypothetical protein